MDRTRKLALVGAALSQQGLSNADIRANAVFLDSCAEAAVNALRASQHLKRIDLEDLPADEQEVARTIARAVLGEANRQITAGR